MAKRNKAQPIPEPVPRSRPPFWFFWVFAAVGFGLYGAFLNNPFIMDDEIQIVGNEHIHSLDQWTSFFSSSTMGSGGSAKMGGVYYKPLMTTAWALLWHFFPSQPWAFRLLHVWLHVANAFLIFLLAQTFFSGPHARRWAFGVGLIFLVHPLNAEVVLYLADLQDALYLFFGLLTLWLVQRLRAGIFLLFAVSLSLMAATLSKETGLLFLVIAVGFAYVKHRSKWKWVLASSMGVLGIYAALRWNAGLTRLEYSNLIFPNLPFSERLAAVPRVLAHYIELWVFPLRLSLATDFRPEAGTLTTLWLPLGVCLAFGVGLIFLFRLLHPKKATAEFFFFLGVLGLWFGLHTHLAFPLDGMYADRWGYLWVWVVTQCFFLALFHLDFPWKGKKAAVLGGALLGVWGFALSLRTWVRGEDFSDALRLYSREAKLHPKDAVMANNVGVELFRRGDIAQAGLWFEKSTQLNSHWFTNWNNLGAFFEKQGNEVLAEDAYRKSVQFGAYALAYENLATLLARQGRLGESLDFIETRGLEAFPYNEKLRNLQRIVRDEIARVQRERGQNLIR